VTCGYISLLSLVAMTWSDGTPGRADAKSAESPVLRRDELLGNRRNRWALPRASGGESQDRLSDLDELSSSVRRVAEGGSVLDPSVVAQLAERPRGDDDPLHELSEREREVLSLMAEGKSNKAIGETLWISEHTVEKHVKSIFGKLRLPSSPDDHRRVLAVLSYLDCALVDPSLRVGDHVS